MKDLLKKYRIDFETSDEAVEISNILLSLGISVFSPETIKKDCEEGHWNCFIYEEDDDYGDNYGPSFSLSRKEHRINIPTISYNDFICISKNYKRIERPDIDPYGEEDWGYIVEEKLITKFKIFKKFEGHEDVDPYGEEDWDNKNEIKEGDIVTAIKDVRSGRSYRIHKGVNYKVVDVGFDGNAISLKGQSSWFSVNSFKKVNESHEDIDPYNEENWDDGKLTVRKYKYKDGHSYNGYRFFVFKDKYMLKNLTTQNFEFEDAADGYRRTINLTIEDKEELILDVVWLTNEYQDCAIRFDKWKYSDMVEVFGKENIIL